MAKAVRRIAHSRDGEAHRLTFPEATMISAFAIGVTVCTLIVLAVYAGILSTH